MPHIKALHPNGVNLRPDDDRTIPDGFRATIAACRAASRWRLRAWHSPAAAFDEASTRQKGTMMIRKLMTAAAATAVLAASPALAAACKDARGKFVKCPAASASAAHSGHSATKDNNGKCRVTSGPKKGSFAKCK